MGDRHIHPIIHLKIMNIIMLLYNTRMGFNNRLIISYIFSSYDVSMVTPNDILNLHMIFHEDMNRLYVSQLILFCYKKCKMIGLQRS
jgi:hypothetical protein